jgi:sulfatase modifying factor 1
VDAAGPDQLRFRLLGQATLCVAAADSPRILPQKGLALLVYLAMSCGRSVSRTVLADLLWGDRVDSQARQNLRQCILTVRRDLGPALRGALVVEDQSLALGVDRVEVDALQFVACAGAADLTERRRCLDLPWGQFLSSFSTGAEGFDEWAAAERQRFDTIAARAFAELAERFDAAGDGELAIAALERLIAIDPAEEHRHRRLLALEARSRGADAALARGKMLTALLKREFDAAPEPATLALLDDIRRSARTQFEDVRTVATEPHDDLIPIGPTAITAAAPLRVARAPRVIAAYTLAVLAMTGVALAWMQASMPFAPIIKKGNDLVLQVARTTDLGVQQAPRSFKDCGDCPEMVVLPAGEFMMGSSESEFGHLDVEGLPRRVVIPARIAIGKFEVTVDQFSAFVAETGTTAGNHCHVIEAPDRSSRLWGPPVASFRQPGFDVMGSQPVVCINWHEAHSYVGWLRRRTGKPYRLPTEAEWEYAARAGTRTPYSFGNDETALCAYARFADLDSPFAWRDGCRSDVLTYGPLPVGSLKPNPWGLFDMHGNAWEWVEDCWTPNALEIPTDGSAFSRPGSCEMGVIRGGSFSARSRRTRSAIRIPTLTARHDYNAGFRVALSLDD